MNPTRNVKYIEVAQDIFDSLCEKRFDELVSEVQAEYKKLKNKLMHIQHVG